MNKLLVGLAEFPRWLWLVVKKWVWLIALLPAILDIVSVYVPGFPQVQIPWQWSVGIGCLGVFVSVYLVYLDLKARLAVYEEHEPDFDLQVLEMSCKACRPDQIHIECKFRMTRRNPWLGELVELSLADKKLPPGFAPGMLSHREYQPLDWHCYNPLKFPYVIPHPGCDFKVTVHYPVSASLESQNEKPWERMVVRLCLLIGYETQPIGYVQKSLSLDIPVDLGKVFEDIVRSGIEGTQ